MRAFTMHSIGYLTSTGISILLQTFDLLKSVDGGPRGRSATNLADSYDGSRDSSESVVRDKVDKPTIFSLDWGSHITHDIRGGDETGSLLREQVEEQMEECGETEGENSAKDSESEGSSSWDSSSMSTELRQVSTTGK
jgi:hypothetical protein